MDYINLNKKMSKIKWLLNDAPSLPVSTFVVDPNIFNGNIRDLDRKLDTLRWDILFEFEVHVDFEFEHDNFTGKTTINVIS